ncbi:MAG: hypothetical protein IJK02_12650 [Clostridia bacterium]|nr:hypothetical protein [Clostridia bacterium]
MQHNNVFFSSADVDRYREKLKTDPAARARYEKYTQTVEKDLTEPYASWEEANDSDTQGGNFGVLHSQADRLSVSLGLKYLVEGDLRCAERFKGLLAHFIAFTRLYGENAGGLLITDGEVERELWFNHQADGHVMHDNSNNILGGYETDAYMLLITRNKVKNDARALAVSCSYLRRDDAVFLAGFRKTTAEVCLP